MIANELDIDSPLDSTTSTTSTTSSSSSSSSSRGSSKENTPPTPSDPEIDSINLPAKGSTETVTVTATATTTKKIKKHKPLSRAPIATGISTNIPVTGEKPKPIQEGDASLEDNVLYKIFLILYDKDPKEEGMTVKQLCEMLETLHPELVNMSSKTSNLVSAKLNAYIKKLEKADLSLQYAISREWADASPKRMVYKYRGLLASGWEKVLDELKKIEDAKQKLQKQQQQQQQQQKEEEDNNNNNNNDDENNENSSDASGNTSGVDDESSDISSNITRKNSTMGVSIKQTPTPVESPPVTSSLGSNIPFETHVASNPPQPQKRRATMFDLGRPTLEEFCVPYGIAPVVASLNVFHEDTDDLTAHDTIHGNEDDDDEAVLEDVLETESHQQQQHHHHHQQQGFENPIRIKRRRLTWTPSPFTSNSFSCQTNNYNDDLGLAAFRALSAGGSGKKKKWFELTEMPKPELTSLSELEKYWD